MRVIILLLVLSSLSACVIPHPADGFDRDATARANGHEFTVNWNDREAQATRTSVTWNPPFSEVALGAIAATQAVTGCRVRPASLTGDVTLVRMTLDCPA